MGEPMRADELMDDREQPTKTESGSWRIAGSTLAALVMRLNRGACAKRGQNDPITRKPFKGIRRDLAGAIMLDAMAEEARTLEPYFAGPDWERQATILPKVMELRRRAETALGAMGATEDGHRF